MSEPEIGATGTAAMTVKAPDLASAFRLAPEDAFPPVYATARMVALMEIAAARVLAPHLAEGERSVGVLIEVTHSAATPEGVGVEAVARYLGREGKQHRFEVVARDRGGEIGRAIHARAVVSSDRLVAGAVRRNSRRENDASEVRADGVGPVFRENAAESEAPEPRAPVAERPLTNPRGVGLARAPVRLRDTGTTLGAWRVTLISEEGEGSVTLIEASGQPLFYRGEGVCLGWRQESLAAAFAALRPVDDEPPLELPQLG
jgi:predicted thioesterase